MCLVSFGDGFEISNGWFDKLPLIKIITLRETLKCIILNDLNIPNNDDKVSLRSFKLVFLVSDLIKLIKLLIENGGRISNIVFEYLERNPKEKRTDITELLDYSRNCDKNNLNLVKNSKTQNIVNTLPYELQGELNKYFGGGKNHKKSKRKSQKKI